MQLSVTAVSQCLDRNIIFVSTVIHCEAKKLHRFIFAIALSELHLL